MQITQKTCSKLPSKILKLYVKFYTCKLTSSLGASAQLRLFCRHVVTRNYVKGALFLFIYNFFKQFLFKFKIDGHQSYTVRSSQTKFKTKIVRNCVHKNHIINHSSRKMSTRPIWSSGVWHLYLPRTK